MAEQKDKKSLLIYLKNEYDRMDVDFKTRSVAFEKQFKQFRGIIPDDQKNLYKSRLFIQKTKSAIMLGLANIADILFANSEFFDVAGRTEVDQKGAGIIKKVALWLVAVGSFIGEAVRYILQATIYGTTFGKIIKEKEVEVSVDKFPILNFFRRIIGFENRHVKRIVQYPVFKTVSIWDVRIDPLATSIKDASGLFQNFRKTLGYLKTGQAQKYYKNISQAEAYVNNKRSQEDRRRVALGLPPIDTTPEELDLKEYWGLVPAEYLKEEGIKVEKDEYEIECIITTINFDVVIRAERNKFPGQKRMWVSDVWEPSGEESIYGRGICENTRGSQMALNATINLRLDNKAWAIAAPIAVNSEEIEDMDDLKAKPNWIIRTMGRPQDIVRAINIPDVTQGSYQEAGFFSSVMEEESGMQAPVQGGPFGSNRTAQGVSIAFSAASRPIRLIARGFEQNLITKGLKLLYMNFLVDLNDEILIRLLDDPKAPEFVKVDPMSLSLDIDFIPTGTFALASRESVAQNIVQFGQAMAQVPGVAQQINWSFLVKKFYEALFGLKDWDKVWLGGELVANPTGTPGASEEAAGGSSGIANLEGLIAGLGKPEGGAE